MIREFGVDGWKLMIGAVGLGAERDTLQGGCWSVCGARSAELDVEFSADEHASDFLGSGADGVESGVSPHSVDTVVVCVAVCAEDLHGIRGDFDGSVRGVEDGACAVAAADMAEVARARDGVDVGARRRNFGVHVGDLGLHQLEVCDGLVELLALVRIADRVVKRALSKTEWTTGEHKTLQVQARHEHCSTAVHGAEHVGGRNTDIVKVDLARVRTSHAHLVQLRQRGKASHAAFQDKRSDAFRTRFHIRLGVHDERG